MFKKTVVLILFSFLINDLYCQKHKFALQTNYISNIIFSPTQYETDIYLINKKLQYGIDFGMIIHKNIYNKSQKSIFGFESGITYTNLKYKTSLNFTTNSQHIIYYCSDKIFYLN